MSTKKAGDKSPTPNLNRSKGSKTIRHSETKSEAFAATESLRETQKKKVLKWFADHPDEAKCNMDLTEIAGLPINCITKVVRELLDENRIEHAFDGLSRHSHVKVRHVRFARVRQLEIPFP